MLSFLLYWANAKLYPRSRPLVPHTPIRGSLDGTVWTKGAVELGLQKTALINISLVVTIYKL